MHALKLVMIYLSGEVFNIFHAEYLQRTWPILILKQSISSFKYIGKLRQFLAYKERKYPGPLLVEKPLFLCLQYARG